MFKGCSFGKKFSLGFLVRGSVPVWRYDEENKWESH